MRRGRLAGQGGSPGPSRHSPFIFEGRGPSSCISKMPEGLVEPAESSRPWRPAACGLLFLARWIRLPRRHMGSRRRVRPDRLRHPRGLRGAAEAQQRCGGMGAMLLKHRQDGFEGEGWLNMHVAMHSARILTDGSGEAASTPKIVSDVTRVSIRGWPDNDEAAGSAASSRELAFRLLYVRRPGAGIRRLCTPGRKVRGFFEKAGGDVRIRSGHCKLEKGCRLFG
jgi:hypothetical protein